jgi:hypothetical protein
MTQAFESRIVQLGANGAAVLQPGAFEGRVSEGELEKVVLSAPEALGEDLLPIGNQLADFSEDKQRLDVLALDTSGEVVLIELKVDEQFGLTDVQAIAYAGAYADLPTSHYAETLHRSITAAGGDFASTFQQRTGLGPEAAVEDVRATIVEFLALEDFDAWEPSQQVRIKLVAPGFTRRVLKNVKWLNDVYGMPIEAIRAQLFGEDGSLQVSFERLLPLAGDELFGLTVRDREVQRREKNEGRRRRARVFPLLIANDVLKDGDRLWLIEEGLKTEHRGVYEEGNQIFSGEVLCSTPPKLVWRSAPNASPEEISPASLAHRVCQELLDEEVEGFGTPVAEYFRLGTPDGPTLGELAAQHGLWA